MGEALGVIRHKHSAMTVQGQRHRLTGRGRKVTGGGVCGHRAV